MVPVGGGGLISGIAYTAKHIRPSVKVYGVQMAGAPSMYNSIHDGKIETLDTVQTVADGIAVKRRVTTRLRSSKNMWMTSRW